MPGRCPPRFPGPNLPVGNGSARGATADLADVIVRGGVLVVDKPPGPTSHDVVSVVRRALRNAKTGHTGTLDPAATGVLPIVIGKATRLAQFLAASEKEYLARIRLGAATDTYDASGTITAGSREPMASVAPGAIEDALARFRGRQMQAPPAFSAKQAGGVRAYEQARKGRSIELAEAEVEVYSLELVSVEGVDLTVRMVTSPGFYVRSFAHDLGLLLGSGGHLLELRRLRSGVFGLDGAVTLDVVAGEREEVWRRMVGIDSLLPHLKEARLTEEGCRYLTHGRELDASVLEGPFEMPDSGPIRLVSDAGRLVGIGSPGASGTLRPTIVLV